MRARDLKLELVRKPGERIWELTILCAQPKKLQKTGERIILKTTKPPRICFPIAAKLRRTPVTSAQITPR